MSVNPFGESSTSARRRTSTIVAYEIVGFLAIIALSWMNELLGVPSLIFGSDHLGGWHESLVETAIILLVANPGGGTDATASHPTALSRRIPASLRLVPKAPHGQ